MTTNVTPAASLSPAEISAEILRITRLAARIDDEVRSDWAENAFVIAASALTWVITGDDSTRPSRLLREAIESRQQH